MEDKDRENWQRTFALFELEYKQAVERYDNIYKAIWQIFSYMAILAGGILTFGSRNFSFPIIAIVSIALTPLVFWFLAIYIPMNHYGEKARDHLKEMEVKFNKISANFLNTFFIWELKHYRGFDSNRNNFDSGTTDYAYKKGQVPWRVQNAVYFFGGTIVVVWVILCVILLTLFLFRVIPYSINLLQLQKPNFEKIELKLEPVEVTMQKPQFQELESKLDSLYQKIDSLESLIRDIKTNSDRQ